MESTSPTGMAPLSHVAWQELLACSVGAPEFEPPIRRRSRRYGVRLGAWRMFYQDGHKLVELRVKLANAALEGVMLLSHEAVPEDIPAVLAFTADDDDEHRLVGEIVHCTSTVGGYKVGVRLHFPDSTDDPR
jgi:hypothetical protein